MSGTGNTGLHPSEGTQGVPLTAGAWGVAQLGEGSRPDLKSHQLIPKKSTDLVGWRGALLQAPLPPASSPGPLPHRQPHRVQGILEPAQQGDCLCGRGPQRCHCHWQEKLRSSIPHWGQ